jgi:hypothetical protein
LEQTRNLAIETHAWFFIATTKTKKNFHLLQRTYRRTQSGHTKKMMRRVFLVNRGLPRSVRMRRSFAKQAWLFQPVKSASNEPITFVPSGSWSSTPSGMKMTATTMSTTMSTKPAVVQVQTRYLSAVDPQVEGAHRLLDQGKLYELKAYLVNNHVSVDAHPNNEDTLLARAAQHGNREACRFLIDECGASLNATCDCPLHRTALHYAVRGFHLDCVNELLSRGGDPDLPDAKGESARDYLDRDIEAEMQVVERHKKMSSSQLSTFGKLQLWLTPLQAPMPTEQWSNLTSIRRALQDHNKNQLQAATTIATASIPQTRVAHLRQNLRRLS